MLVLGIESSCDDTSVALVDSSAQGHFVVNEKTASQVDVHAAYGGVVPEIAGRMHAEKIVPLIQSVLDGHPRPEIIAVTAGPGLVTGLVVGIEAAKALAYAWNIPLVAVNHIAGHIHSVLITKEHAAQGEEHGDIHFPAVCLVASGGHTELILMNDHGDYHYLGRTKDDAVGECFDKVAKLLGLPYPGGPEISRLAAQGRSYAIAFPRPMLRDPGYDFSFAGLKTAALYWLRDHELAALDPLPKLSGAFVDTADQPITRADFCASVEQAAIDVLIGKTLRAVGEFRPASVILVGGVSANRRLRDTLAKTLTVQYPSTACRLSPAGYSMDNGAMIAVAGYYQAYSKDYTDWKTLTAHPNWKIIEPLP